MQDYGLVSIITPHGRVRTLLLKQSKVYNHRLTKTGNCLFKMICVGNKESEQVGDGTWLIFTKLLQKNWNGTLAKFKK